MAKRPTATNSLLKLVLSPLAIRLPLFDPSPWLQRMTIPAALLFHPVSVVVASVGAAVLLLSVLGQTLDTNYRISHALRNMQGDRWLSLLMCYLIVKSLHELGHALASIRYGVACKEIGLLFLFFTPCLYCDTTDSWKLTSKWRRAAIAAAGMYVELWLATIAAAVWLATRDGVIHSLATSVMIVCSVGTLLVNANPLLKYDGYYILADVWSVPNLAEQSRDATWSLLTSALTGRPLETSHLDANVWSLAGYAFIASVYRTLLICVIMYVAWSTLVPFGLGFVAVNILIALLFGMVVMMLRAIKAGYREFFLAGTLRFSRVVVMFTILLVVIALICEVPVNTYVAARAVSDFADKTALFAPLRSELVWSAPIGKLIQKGSPVVRLDAPDQQLELTRIRSELALAQLKSIQLEQRSAIDEAVAFEIPAAREVIAELQAKERLLLDLLGSLTLTATQDGRLIPTNEPMPQLLSAPLDERANPGMLDPSNRGCTLERGVTIGWFTPQGRQTLTAIVSQQDVKLLNLNMEVTCRWDADMQFIAQGTILRIAPDPIEETPVELLGDPTLVSLRNPQGKMAPEIPHYEVTVALADDCPPHLKGALASVRIRVASRTLLASAVRYLQMSFKPVY